MDFERLVSEHDQIDLLSRHILDLTGSGHAQVEAASAALRNLAVLVVDHLAGEDTMVYPTFLKMRDGGDSEAATAMVADLELLKDDWTQYLGDWTPEYIAADWDGFRQESRDMLARLQARVRRETSLLYPIALQYGIINLRAPRIHA